jgi:ATP-dependent protease HslVU (ClpYQ) peptidase subunit
MSVCICLLCHGHGPDHSERRIVFVEDRKVTFTDFSADKAVTKNTTLVENWWAQFAGNDAEQAPLIIDTARRRIVESAGKTRTADLIVRSLQSALLNCRDQQIETKILRKHGFTFQSFRDDGKTQCSESVYDELHDRIDRFKFSLEFMVAGFDPDSTSHLYHLDSHGSLSCYDDLGFWAIGSGAHAALSSLSFHVEHDNLCAFCSCVHNAVYFGCEAKFMAETSVEVGKESTLVMIHEPNEKEVQFFFNNEAEKIKKAWLKYGAPKPSERVMKHIYDLMKSPPSKRDVEP